MKYIKYILVFLILVLSPIGWIKSQKKIDSLSEDKFIETIVYIPSGKFLKTLTLGYGDIVADILWIRTTLYFGTHVLTDREYKWLYRFLESITDLDPYFHFPYIFGGIVLSEELGQPKLAIDLLYKGYMYIDNDWRIPFFIGYNYFLYLNNKKMAARFIKIASEYKNSPEYLKGLFILLLYEEGEKKIAEVFLKQAQQFIKDEAVIQSLEKKIKEYDKKAHKDSTINNFNN